MANAQQVEFLNAGMGAAYALGWVYTYEAGLIGTDKDVYTAADKSASPLNPFQLDADGRATIYAEGNYAFVIKDVNLANPITIDNLYYGLPSSSELITSITATTYTVLSTDRYVICNAVSGAIVITLPAASGMSGVEIKFVKTDASAYTVTVGSFSPLTGQNQALIIKSDGTNWRIIARYDASSSGVLNKTDSYTVTTNDIGRTLRLTHASAKIFTLPSMEEANDGGRFTFVKLGAGSVTIQAVDTDIIADSAATGKIVNSVATEIYASITLEYVHSSTTFIIVGAHGTWVTT